MHQWCWASSVTAGSSVVLGCFHCEVKKCNCAISHTNPSLTRMRIPLPCCFAQVQWLSWTRSRRSSMRSSWPRTWTCQPSCRSTRSSALPTTSAPCSTSPARPRSADIWLAIAFGRGCLSILFLVVSLRFAPVFDCRHQTEVACTVATFYA